MLDRNLHDEMLSLARSALSAPVGDADQLYTEIIGKLKLSLASNQKEMAAALQTIARQIESEGLVDEAFAFKQRTCAVMLQMSMTERHAGRGTPPPVAARPARSEPTAVAAPSIKSPFRALYFTGE